MFRRHRSFRSVSRRYCRRALGAIEALESRILLSGNALNIPGLTFDPDNYDASSILVKFRTSEAGPDNTSQIVQLPEAAGIGQAIHVAPGLRQVYLNDGVSVESALAAYRGLSSVEYAEPNYRVSVQAVPNDPQFDSLWGMNNTGQTGGTTDADIDATAAWDITTGSGNQIVAVLDTGVDYLHEDLAANMWTNAGEIAGDGIDNDGNGYVDDIHGYDFANNDGDPMDDHHHGTHVAGTIGAVGNNGVGVTGVNWHVQIMALKFLDSSGNGDTADAIEALDYAVANGARISNNSWGFNGGFSQALYDAVQNAQSAGHIFVAAAGNGNFLGFGLDNDTEPFWPGNIDLDNVVTVAAVDNNDNLAIFSNYGATTVDLAAPGVDILSTFPNNQYGLLSGTSMATPHVAGAIALLWDSFPDLTYREVIDQIYASVDPLSELQGITVTGGRLNIDAALSLGIYGPRVELSSPDGPDVWPVNHFRVLFNEPINAATFTVDDVISFTGPSGPIPVTAVNAVAGSTREFEITFAEQTAYGNYQIVLGPEIADLSGDLMDQDRDEISGEIIDDRFIGNFAIEPFSKKFDFGTSSSPVESDYIQVTPQTAYNPASGYGWESESVKSVDRATGTSVSRDINFNSELVFGLDAPVGTYQVKLTIGDLGTFAHDEMAFFIDGVLVETINTAAGQVLTKQYLVNATDTHLQFRLTDLGGLDPSVVINGLEVQWIGLDTSGPQVVEQTPATTATGSVDRITLSFSEPIDVGTFTLADVIDLSGPAGSITPTAINQIEATVFEVVFPEQSELGDYTITIGPDIADLAGNLMDQDQDEINGESLDDLYTGTFTLGAYSAQFDFGTSSSPTQVGWQQVLKTTTYNIAQGFGWQAGTVSAVDRSTGTALERDLNFGQDMTFAADVPSDMYDVTLYLGDKGGYAHDQMGIFIEGVQVDTVSTAAGQVQALTYRVIIQDGQLNVQLKDLGGSDVYVVIAGLEIAQLEADTSGPQVIDQTPSSIANGAVDRITLTFSEPIDAGTFTLADVVNLSGPSGSITPTAINQLGPTVFEVVFAEQRDPGTYSLTIGPDIADLAGNLMNQDQDETNGEAIDDRYTGSFMLEPFSAQYDFGTASSLVETGWQQVLKTTTYNASQGFGWQSGTVSSVDRSSGTALLRDLNFGRDITFAVDLSSNVYDVTLYLGDKGNYAHDQMGIFIEGVQVDTVSTAPGEVVTRTYQASIQDGQLNVQLKDLGGSDAYVVIAGLEIALLEADTSGPQVVAQTPSATVSGSVDRIVVSFSEAIDAATFTLADVVNLSGPSGTITPIAVNPLGAAVFEVVFAEQSELGDYTLTIGPDISDVSGNLMDQDQDGNGGEAIDDRYTGTFTLESFSARFDFGTSTSPVEADWQQVINTTAYNSTQGFGWQSGSVSAVSRSSGTALTRDLNFGRDITFAVDVAAGTYDVTVYLGDQGSYAHDQMGVFIEGIQVDTVSTAAGEVVTRTYQANIPDGQLTLRLTDLGGSDAFVVIAGLEILAVVETAAVTQISATETNSPVPGSMNDVLVVPVPEPLWSIGNPIASNPQPFGTLSFVASNENARTVVFPSSVSKDEPTDNSILIAESGGESAEVQATLDDLFASTSLGLDLSSL